MPKKPSLKEQLEQLQQSMADVTRDKEKLWAELHEKEVKLSESSDQVKRLWWEVEKGKEVEK